MAASLAHIGQHVDRLLSQARRVSGALAAASIPYRVVGGVAVFLHVDEVDSQAARLTRDIDLSVNRADLQRVVEAVRPMGFTYRHVAGLDMLLDPDRPGAKNAVHLVLAGERVRPEDPMPVPPVEGPVKEFDGVAVAPMPDLLVMKLTSFRLKDQVHVQDMDGVGLITGEVEAALPPMLRERLEQVRRTR